MNSPAAPARSGLVLLIASAATFVAFLDVTIVNVALPDLQADFSDSSLGTLSWVISGYAVVFAAFLTPAGRLADGIGRKSVFMLGFALFTLASAGCALAPDVGVLIAVRALQGLGAAMMIPAALGLVLATQPPQKIAAAVGLWGAASSIAAVAGPSLGGVFVDVFGWRSVFLVNVPLGLLVLAMAATKLPDPAPAKRRLPDLLGASLLAAAFVATAGGLTEAGTRGWSSPLVLGLVAAGVAMLVAALLRARSQPLPALNVELWRDRPFALANAGSLLLGVALYAWLLSGILWLTQVWDYSIIEAGLAVSPGAFASAAAAIVAGRRVDQRGPLGVILLGGSLLAATAVWLLLAADAEPAFLSLWLWTGLTSGVAFGTLTVGLTTAAARALAPQDFAAGTGLNLTARQLGGALGIAVLASILAGAPSIADYHAVWAVCGGAALLIAIGAFAAGRHQAAARAPVAESVSGSRVS